MTVPVRITLIVGSTVIWFGITLWAAGGPAVFFSHPPLVGFAVVMGAMGVAALFVGGNLSSGVKEDRGNRWVVVAFTVLSVFLTVVPAWSDHHDILTVGGDTLRWVGVVLFAVGAFLRLLPVYLLGDRFSGLVAIQPGHRLLTTGLYSVIRHPSYLGLLIASLGWSLAFRSVLGLGITVLFLLVLVARIDAEERLLHETFGAEYDAWRARTARLIPGVW
jgi:protein-S-isoprenylcysteine O-methyltransferase Ste14